MHFLPFGTALSSSKIVVDLYWQEHRTSCNDESNLASLISRFVKVDLILAVTNWTILKIIAYEPRHEGESQQAPLQQNKNVPAQLRQLSKRIHNGEQRAKMTNIIQLVIIITWLEYKTTCFEVNRTVLHNWPE